MFGKFWGEEHNETKVHPITENSDLACCRDEKFLWWLSSEPDYLSLSLARFPYIFFSWKYLADFDYWWEIILYVDY